MTSPTSPFVRFLRFLGKVQFTTALLLGGAVIMTIGTILESRGSREIAWSAVYGTVWFDLFLFLIGINLVIAVINRLPIQRHQWPFVVTHFAIVILLAGAWISRTYGYEGRLMVHEGEQENRLYLDAAQIDVRWLGGARADAAGQVVDARFELPQSGRIAGRTLQEASNGLPGIEIAEYVPNGSFTTELREGPIGASPGVEVLLTKGRQQVQHWFIAGDPNSARKDLGPLAVEFRQVASGDPARSWLHGESIGAASVLVSPADGSEPVRIALPERVGEEVPLGPGLVARVRGYFARARIADGKLVEKDSGELNPAVVVELIAGGRTEVHTVFSRYPDFSSVQGGEPAQPAAALVSLEVATRVEKPQLAILLGPDERFSLQLTTESGASPPMPVEVGGSASLAAIGIDLRLERWLPNARAEFGVRPAPPGSQSGQRHVRLNARMNGTQQSVWLKYGAGPGPAIRLGGGQLQATYGPQTLALPFAIALEEFELINYPGSDRAAEYRSHVQVKPAASDLPAHDEVISMNRPLDVAGFRLFQSSYKLASGGRPDATILSVSYDPGVPIVYFSFLLLIVGIAWGLRVPRPKAAHAAGVLERQLATPGEGQAAAQREPRGAEAPAARKTMGSAVTLLLAVLVSLAPALDGWAESAAAGEVRLPVEETSGWAILADGRTKPLLTYANETALAVTGRESLDGLSSLELLWGYVLSPDEFKARPYIRVDSLELKAELELDAKEKRFSYDALADQPAFRELVSLAFRRQRAEEELSRLDRDVLEAYTKVDRIEGLVSGRALTIVPTIDEHGHWMTPSELEGHGDAPHVAIFQGFRGLAAAYAAGEVEGFADQAGALGVALRNSNPKGYPSESQLGRELFYEAFNAFGKAWKLYLLGFLAVLLAGFSQRPWGYRLGLGLLVAGFLCHSIGLGIRWIIADRAPVSDMYESLVFMGWGAIALGLGAEALNRKRFLALAAGLMGFVCLAFAENLPINSGINPLMPVLAHTYWLSVHVMTIMLSYSALALAMVLGHLMIAVQVFQRQKIMLLSSLSQLVYKTLQIGVLFLAAGIIFGSIWANESWGRYWGWDPKETWSLITFFVYLAIIHARFAGWLRHFGLAASAILGFLAVVMTYYGVNFILSAGMHAYGFSEGGQFFAGLYAVVEIAIVAGARVWYVSANRVSPDAVVESHPTQA